LLRIVYWSRVFGLLRLCSRFQPVLLRRDEEKSETAGYWRHLPKCCPLYWDNLMNTIRNKASTATWRCNLV